MAVLAAIALVWWVGAPYGDFANYWVSASLVVEGADLSRIYEYRWFTDQAARLGLGDKLVAFTVLTPPSALLALPLVPLSAEGAARAWQLGQLMLVVLSAGVLARALAWRLWQAMLLWVAIWPALSAHLQQGQAHLPPVLVICLGILAILHDRRVLAGAAWGLAVGLKVHAWPLVAAAAVARRWSVLAAAGATLLLGGLVSLAALGPVIHQQFFTDIGPRAAAGYYTHPWHVGLQGFGHLIRQLWVPHVALNPDAVARPALAAFLPAALQLAAVAVTLGHTRFDDRQHTLRSLCAASFVTLATGPILASYHLVALFPALGLAAASLSRRRAALVVALIALAAWCPTPSHWLAEPWTILSIPRFWLLLAAWAVVIPWRVPRAAWGLAGIALALPQLFGEPAALPASAEPFDHPDMPLVVADLLAGPDGALYFSGLAAPSPELPGTGWIGYRWHPDEAGPQPVAGAPGAHVWSPRVVDGEVRWGTGPTGQVGATSVELGSHRYFLSDHGVGVKAHRLWRVPRRD